MSCRSLAETLKGIAMQKMRPLTAKDAEIHAEVEALQNDLFPMQQKTKSTTLCLSLPKATQLTDSMKEGLNMDWIETVNAALMDVSSERGCEEILVLSFATHGAKATMDRLQNPATLSFASSICQGRPWTASRPASTAGLQPSLLSMPQRTHPDTLTRGKVTNL